jgi:hypothetical protein
MSKRPSPNEVIDLCGIDDEPSQHLDDVRKRLKSGDTPKVKSVKSEAKQSAPVDLIDDDDDEVMFVEPQPKTVPAAASLSSAEAEEDIEVVGTKNHVRLPHARQHCTEKPFQNDSGFSEQGRTAVNKEICDRCYCYVCDIPASDCKTWLAHCLATNQGPKAAFWLSRRNALKISAPQAPADDAQGHALQNVYQQIMEDSNRGNHTEAGGAGPFPPNHAQPGSNLTQCRHCSWFNKFTHKNFAFQRNVAAGRVASREPRWYIGGAHRNEVNPTGYLGKSASSFCVLSFLIADLTLWPTPPQTKTGVTPVAV